MEMGVATTEKPADRPAAPPGARGKTGDRVTVENVNVPRYATHVDAGMYEAMRLALLKVLPAKEPGLTQGEMREAVVPHLPHDFFPGGAKAGWWAKFVQLDLEAKGVLAREATKPLRWHRPASK
jgi:hypothetical protein